MKRCLLLLMCSLILFGCTNKKNDKKGDNTDKNVIVLEGNPTTGYQWTCKSEDEDLISISSNYISNNENSDVKENGSGGKYYFSIKGLKEGKTNIICTYKRSWEETEYDEEKKYEVSIDKNLSILYSELN